MALARLSLALGIQMNYSAARVIPLRSSAIGASRSTATGVLKITGRVAHPIVLTRNRMEPDQQAILIRRARIDCILAAINAVEMLNSRQEAECLNVTPASPALRKVSCGGEI
jgi:hypothetical protein